MTDATSRENAEGLAAGYALDALSDQEQAEYERALAEFPELRAEADGFVGTSARLAEQIEPVSPPPELKNRLMAMLDETPQLPAQPTGRHLAPVAELPATDATAAESAEPPPAGPRESEARRRWFQRPGGILGVAAAAVLLVAGVLVGAGFAGPNGWSAQRVLASITDAPDAQTTTTEVSGGGTVTLTWSAEKGRSAVTAKGLSTLASDKTYELWYIDSSGATSAGLFSDGSSWRVLDGKLPSGAKVGITVEPAGGSKQPTTDPIAVIAT